MNTCPCCSNSLLRHVRHNNIYWFCQHCHEEMPDLESVLISRHQRLSNLENLLNLSSWTPSLRALGQVSGV